MVADKVFNLQTNSQLVYQSDIPIKGKTFIKVFIDRVGEGTWETIDGSEYQLINDSIVFSVAPTGFLLIMQVATTPTELQQTPTDISMLLTVRAEIKELALHVGELVIVTDDISSVISVASNITQVVTVANNIADVQSVVDNLTELILVSTDIDKVVTVADNIASVNSVVTEIIPNLSEILQADTNAQIATTKATEASTSATNALASENKAKKWADEEVDVPVETGKYSAKHWAQKAEDVVTDTIIDDSTPLLTKTYSSSKVQDLHNLQAQAIVNLATSQGEFAGTGSPSVLVLTTTEQILPFDVTIPSTNTAMFDFDDTNNRVTFKVDASYNFRTSLSLLMLTDSSRTITVTGRNYADDSIVYQREVTVNGTNNDIIPVDSNQLLTVGKNGIPSAPLTIYFTFKVDSTGVTLRDLSSILTSSSSYSELNIEDTMATPIASATNVVIGATGLGDTIHITGTTAINSLGTAAQAGVRRALIFDSAGCVLTHGINLICPGAVNITSVDGMVVKVVADTTAIWRVESIMHPSVSVQKIGYMANVIGDLQAQLNVLQPSSFNAYKNTSQVISTNVVTKVLFQSIPANGNIDGVWDTTLSRFVATEDGEWFINARVGVISTATLTDINLVLYKNGVNYKGFTRVDGNTGTALLFSVSCPAIVEEGDYLEIYATAGSAGTITVGSGDAVTYVHGHLIRRF